MVILLTKKDCPQCQQLKMFLKYGLNNKYEQDIKIVNKETDTLEFNELISKYGILSLPAFISNSEILTNTQPTPVVAFLEKHVGKK